MEGTPTETQQAAPTPPAPERKGSPAALIVIGVLALLGVISAVLTFQHGGFGPQKTERVAATGVVKEFAMEAPSWVFDPDTVTVSAGDTVRLIIHVPDNDVPHGIGINEFSVNKRLDPGKTETVEFVADLRGTFTYYCSVPCGEGHSRMVGKLIVK